jgi:hypothetical protein
MSRTEKNRTVPVPASDETLLAERSQEPGYVSGVRLKGRAASWFVRLWVNMMRVETIGWEHNRPVPEDRRPRLYVCWHGSQVVPLAFYRGRGIIILTSLSRDGDIQDMSMKCLGFQTVRGSSSRGGARALLGLIRGIREHGAAAVTVDGPRGPYHEAKPGAVLLAQKCDAWVIPVGVAHSRCHHLASWDRFEIPLPFSRSVLVTGAPFLIPGRVPVETGCRLIEERLHACDETATRRLTAS